MTDMEAANRLVQMSVALGRKTNKTESAIALAKGAAALMAQAESPKTTTFEEMVAYVQSAEYKAETREYWNAFLDSNPQFAQYLKRE